MIYVIVSSSQPNGADSVVDGVASETLLAEGSYHQQFQSAHEDARLKSSGLVLLWRPTASPPPDAVGARRGARG